MEKRKMKNEVFYIAMANNRSLDARLSEKTTK